MKAYFSYHQKLYTDAKNKDKHLNSRVFREFKTDLLYFLQASDHAYSFLEKFISGLLQERSDQLKNDLYESRLEEPELLLQGAGIHTSILVHGLLHHLPQFKDKILIVEQKNKVASSFLGHNYRLNSVDVKTLRDKNTGSIGTPNHLGHNPFQSVDFTPSHMLHDTKARDLGLAVLLNYYLSGVKIIFDTQLEYRGFENTHSLRLNNNTYPINPHRIGRSFGPNERILTKPATQKSNIKIEVEDPIFKNPDPFQRRVMYSSEFNLLISDLAQNYGAKAVIHLLSSLKIAFVGFGNGGMTALESIVNPYFESKKIMTDYERLEMQDRIEKNLPRIDIYGVNARTWDDFKENYLIPGGLDRKKRPTMAFIERYSSYGLYEAFESSKTKFFPEKITEISAGKSNSRIMLKSESETKGDYNLVILANGSEGETNLGMTDFSFYISRWKGGPTYWKREILPNGYVNPQKYLSNQHFALDYDSGYLKDFFYGTALPNLRPANFDASQSLTKSPHSIHYLGPGTETLASELAKEIKKNEKP